MNSFSIGVVLPTRNSMPFLESHMKAMNPWLDLVHEVVVVDSESSDGSVDFLRNNLRHANLRFFTHPPGLYASWNHGIRQLDTEYCLISTTGDTISRDGIRSMLDQILATNCDTVLSKPLFTDKAGQQRYKRWPIDEIIDYYSITDFRKLTGLEAAIFAACHPESALLGSCASNIFKTSVLKNLPFPTNCGVSGDGVWGWQHAGEVKWCVSSKHHSTFLVHDPQSARADLQAKPALDASETLRLAGERWVRNGSLTQSKLDAVKWDTLILLLSAYLRAKQLFDLKRQRKPWITHPSAWAARLNRERLRKDLLKQRNNSLQNAAYHS